MYKVINSFMGSNDMLDVAAMKNINVITGLMKNKETKSEIKGRIKLINEI